MSSLPGDIVERRALATLVAAVVVGRLGMDQIAIRVPFLPLLERWANDWQFTFMVDAFWCIGIALMLFPLWRLGSLIAGGAELVRVLSNMAFFSNGRTLDALVLLIAGLCGPRVDNRLLRAQFLLLYAGASLNKLLDVHWRDGTFVLATMTEHLSPSAIAWWQPLAPAAGWITMGVEFLIFLLLLRPATRRLGVMLVLGFHTGLLVMLHEDFGTFYYTVAFGAVLLFYPFAPVGAVTVPGARWHWLATLSCVHVVRDARPANGEWAITWGSHRASGMLAAAILAASCLPIVTTFVLLLTRLSRYGPYRLREAAILAAIGGMAALWIASHPKLAHAR